MVCIAVVVSKYKFYTLDAACGGISKRHCTVVKTMRLFVFLSYIKHQANPENTPDKIMWGVSSERWQGMLKWYHSRIRDNDLDSALHEEDPLD